jgi:hypothetical protein
MWNEFFKKKKKAINIVFCDVAAYRAVDKEAVSEWRTDSIFRIQKYADGDSTNLRNVDTYQTIWRHILANGFIRNDCRLAYVLVDIKIACWMGKE